MKVLGFLAACTMLLTNAMASRVWHSGGEAFENETFLYAPITRDATNNPATVEYSIVPGTAVPGSDYLPTNGAALFSAGERTVFVPVRLIDNPNVDGNRTFRLLLTNASGGLVPDNDACLGSAQIRDDEFAPTREDPTFIQEISSFTPFAVGGNKLLATALPGDRLLLDGGVMLRADGSIDGTFLPAENGQEIIGAPVEGFADAGPQYLAVPPNQVLVFTKEATTLRTLPLENEALLGIMPDGKMLTLSQGLGSSRVRRVHSDLKEDSTFTPLLFAGPDVSVFIPSHAAGASVDPQQKGGIVFAGRFSSVNGAKRSNMVRVNGNGSIDSAFQPQLEEVTRTFVRRNGKLLAWGTGTAQTAGWLLQLNTDGSIDADFVAGPYSRDPMDFGGETPDSKLYFRDSTLAAEGSRLMRALANGAIDPAFVPVPLGDGAGRCNWELPPGGVVVLPSGKILIYRNSTRYVRLNNVDAPPEREFRATASPINPRSQRNAVVRIIRTGSTSAPASVKFRTRDLTAKEGVDYSTRSGMISFPPLISSRAIEIPLLRGMSRDTVAFEIELFEPSASFTNSAPVQVRIWPDLRIDAPVEVRKDGAATLRLQGTLPGRFYHIERSTDLQNWEWSGTSHARGFSTEAHSILQSPPSARYFFRAAVATHVPLF